MGQQYLNGRSEFRILDNVGKVRKVGRNYVTRCPILCADSGHDRSGDNLAILIEDPRFYKCWAGCSKRDDRDSPRLARFVCGIPPEARRVLLS